ncbi:hypothetical protein [Planococcus sp. CPCC 101016]|uniref:hypothetical protein n=1 Tax=Planococcus sp. CPCC 101016 TaxID=2599617 RepID=UPI0037CB534B
MKNMGKNEQVAANGKFTDGSRGLVIYRVESVEACEALVKEDLYVAKGARRCEIFEWESV